MTTEIRWLWLRVQTLQSQTFRVIVSMVKDRGQHIHIHVSPYVSLHGKSLVNKSRVVNPVESLFLWMD